MTNRCVMKVGGSLLRRGDVPARLSQLLETDFSGQQVNLVFGGGRIIDALRDLDSVHAMKPIDMHWRCVRALRLTFELACEWFPHAERIESPDSFAVHRQCKTVGHYIIAADSFYSPRDGAVLPEDWSTTSDSISALLAIKLSIDRLVLVKACNQHDLTPTDAANAGIVDAVFPKTSRHLKIDWKFLGE